MARVSFQVRLTPRGGADQIDGVVDGVLRARVRPPPVDGAANRALIQLLAAALDVPRSSIAVTRGQTGRVKRIEVEGVTVAACRERWPGLAVRTA